MLVITDRELLQRYSQSRDAEAFAELVRRHAGMVYGTCLRINRNPHDAEDAAQDCFVQLALQAAAIHSSVPGWLHRTALSRAQMTNRREGRQRQREEAVRRMTSSSQPEPVWNEVTPHVDEALAELPDELREVLVRHFLEGKSQEQVAGELEISQPSVSRRIEKGVILLRDMLKKRGFVLSATVLGTLLLQNGAIAAPATLTATLGKMALAGIGSPSGAAGAGGAGSSSVGTPLIGGATALKICIVTLAATLVLVSAVYTLGADWKPADQPDLAAKLEAAPEIQFEELAEGPSVAVQGPIWWVPNPDGKTWDMVIIYSRRYQGPHEAFVYDTATRELKKAAVPELEKVRSNFHIVPYFMINGKMIIKPGIGSSDVCFYTYDPATNELKFDGYPLGENVMSADGLLAPNEDGTLFGGFGPLAKDPTKVGFCTIDPVTLKGEFLGEVGPPSKTLFWEYGGVVMDGDWIYARYGNSPWRLYGMNIKTRQGKVIAETEQIIGNQKTITFRTNSEYPGVYVTITGLKGGPTDKTQAFWLRDGQLTPCEMQNLVAGTANPVPPAGTEKLAQPRRNSYGQGEDVPKGMEVIRGRADAEGKVTVWYRFSDANMAEAAKTTTGAWQRIQLPPIKLYPDPIRRMAPLPDGMLFTLGDGYGQALVFDPKTNQRKILGATMSVYSLLPVRDKLYLCGYPSSRVWIYDPAKPWTVGTSMATDTPPDKGDEAAATANSNPTEVAVLKDFADIHIPWAAAEGADGRVYFGGRVVRIGDGGGLGWWDPRENKAGGFHKPFDNYPVFWMCSAANGRYILCSTKTAASPGNTDYVPPRGRIFVYDTTKHELIHQFEDERLVMPGYITEAQPGMVMGYAPTTDKEGKKSGLLYGFDPAAGKILWTKPVPPAPQTAFTFMKRGEYFFAKGPDGFIWATMGGVLARIDPKSAEILPVGKMVDNQLAFVNGEVYVAGSQHFRKITGIPKVTAPK